MEVTGEKAINAPRNRVYDALHDPAVLKRIIPGAQTASEDGPGKMVMEAVGDLGHGVSRFLGQFEFYNEDPPAGYSMRARINGGDAGSMRGNAHIALASINEQSTNLAYHMSADVIGPLAELPADETEAQARALVDTFVDNLAAYAEGRLPAAPAQAPPQRPRTPPRSVTPPTETAPVASAPSAETAPLVPPRTISKGGYDAEYVRDINVERAASRPAPVQPSVAATPAAEVAPMRNRGPYQPDEETLPPGEALQTRWRPRRRDTSALRASSSQPGVGRWLLTALGVGIIAILLSDMF